MRLFLMLWTIPLSILTVWLVAKILRFDPSNSSSSSSPNGLAQRQRRDWQDSLHFWATSGKPRRFPSGGAAVRWSRC